MLDKIHWLGHAAFRIELDKTIIYVDPYQLKKDAPKADIILITHEHFDHCSRTDIENIHQSNTKILAAARVRSALSYSLETMSPGEKIDVGRIRIEAVPAYNVKRSFHPVSNGNLGFIIQVNQVRIYHAGDTDLIPEMDRIKANIALLPVGGTYTMDAREAAQAADIITPDIAVPMHWGSVVGSRKDAEEFQKVCSCKAVIMEIEQ